MNNHPLIYTTLQGSMWVVSNAKMDDIRHFVNSMPLSYDGETQDPLKARGVDVEDGVAVVPMYGTLMKRAGIMTRYSGGTSTDRLASTFRTLQGRDDVDTVVLDIDSPGGRVDGVAVASSALRDLRSEKRVIAVSNDTMASGAYWIGSAADEVYVTPTASTGSIGVYVMMKKADEEAQDKFEIIRAGEFKAKPNPVEPLDDTSVEIVQQKVDKIYAEFVSDISANRDVSLDEAQELADGRSWIGDDAVERGLADGVSSLEEVIARETNSDFTTTNHNEFQTEDNDMAVSEEEFNTLLERVDSLEDRAEQAEARAEEAEAALEEAQADLDVSRAEALVSEFENKIPAESRESWIERVQTLGVEQSRDILTDMPDVMPDADSGAPTRDEQIHEDEQGVPRTDSGDVVAESDTQAEVYRQMNVDYVRG
ncbi:serine peptidase [Salinibacter phage M8CC-19]|uniref:Serine peptidase n=2 Tax=Kryptosalinivirus M8CC19 TaxID=2560720 RepID=A0A2I6UG67_9CAUD|nr:head maturation protease [Salinibacter phage M8CC-19]AUO78960.1 serine peptidase [Salinibacter phage M8CC-19]AUO79194.1 serine peptidase [Salinibacter phage M31CC-1]